MTILVSGGTWFREVERLGKTIDFMSDFKKTRVIETAVSAYRARLAMFIVSSKQRVLRSTDCMGTLRKIHMSGGNQIKCAMTKKVVQS